MFKYQLYTSITMAIETKIKRWGNSMGVILPKKILEQKHLKENDEILIEIVKEADLSDVFGTMKERKKLSGQEFKDMVKKGWKT